MGGLTGLVYNGDTSLKDIYVFQHINMNPVMTDPSCAATRFPAVGYPYIVETFARAQFDSGGDISGGNIYLINGSETPLEKTDITQSEEKYFIIANAATDKSVGTQTYWIYEQQLFYVGSESRWYQVKSKGQKSWTNYYCTRRFKSGNKSKVFCCWNISTH
eukprot:UN27548